MPYKHAPYYVLVVIAVIVAGFWPSYFAKGARSPGSSTPMASPPASGC